MISPLSVFSKIIFETLIFKLHYIISGSTKCNSDLAWKEIRLFRRIIQRFKGWPTLFYDFRKSQRAMEH